jgi:hypothetical protein
MPDRSRRLLSATLGACLAATAAHADGCVVSPLAAFAHSKGHANPQTVFLLNPKTYPRARCADGSPGGYILRQGFGRGAQRLVVELQGGGFCANNDDCSERRKSLTSTDGLISGRSHGPTLDGILSADPTVNPDFYDANAVRVLYCSSDFWTGDKAPIKHPFNRRNAAQTWYFRGREIALAALTALLAKGAATAAEILLTGDSAGGVGVVLDANDLLPLLPAPIHALVASDAGYTLDIGAFDLNSPQTDYISPAKPTPVERIIIAGHAFWGGRGDRVCTESARTGAERDRCYNTADVISKGYLAAPVGTAQALDDTTQLEYDGLPPGPPKHGTPEAIYAAAFAALMTASLEAVGQYNSVYAPYAFIHEMFTGGSRRLEAFDTPHAFPGAGNVTPHQWVRPWYLDPCAGTKLIGAPRQQP